MRWITFGLIALSLVFSTGGVAIVGRADSAVTTQAPAVPGTKADAKASSEIAPTQCAVPTQPRNNAATRRQRSAPLDSGQRTIVLNTTGYNYATAGQWKGSPVGPPQALPEGFDLKSKKAVHPPTPTAPAAK